METAVLHLPDGPFYYRPTTYDYAVYREARTAYRELGLMPSDRVLDIGANIGVFVRTALQHGVEHVTAVEPDPDNFRLLNANVTASNVTLMHAAAMSHPPRDGSVLLYRNDGINKGSHSLVIQGKRHGVSVPTMDFGGLLFSLQPTKLKVDCEGSEYDLLLNRVLPASIQAVAVELHLGRKQWRSHDAPLLVASLERQGFVAVRPPKIGKNNWHTIGVWHREM